MSLKLSTASTERVESSLKQLAAAAQALSAASDDLGKVIRNLDASLKRLGLEITVWVPVSGTSDETQFWSNELGYSRIDGKWGVALREVSGFLPESEPDSVQEWPFNDAPRALRADAVDKIPDLLEQMLRQTQETTDDLNAKIEQASEVAFLVSELVPKAPKASSQPAPQHWKRAGLTASSEGTEGKESGASSRFRETTQAGSTEKPANGDRSAGASTPYAALSRALPVERPAVATPNPLPTDRPS